MTNDPRLLPIARRLCSYADDDWRQGRKLWTKYAAELLTIVDAVDPKARLLAIEKLERQP
jgi:hypothetical protein